MAVCVAPLAPAGMNPTPPANWGEGAGSVRTSTVAVGRKLGETAGKSATAPITAGDAPYEPEVPGRVVATPVEDSEVFAIDC